MRKFVWLVRRQEKGILANFKLRINNASVEDFNNKALGVDKNRQLRASAMAKSAPPSPDTIK
jgi:hypothetical protein